MVLGCRRLAARAKRRARSVPYACCAWPSRVRERPTLFGELDPVVQHVEQDLLQPLRIAEERARDGVGHVVGNLGGGWAQRDSAGR
jgi:hypothetical protein